MSSSSSSSSSSLALSFGRSRTATSLAARSGRASPTGSEDGQGADEEEDLIYTPCSSPASSDADLPMILPFSKREYLLAQIKQKDAIIESLLKQVSSTCPSFLYLSFVCHHAFDHLFFAHGRGQRHLEWKASFFLCERRVGLTVLDAQWNRDDEVS